MLALRVLAVYHVIFNPTVWGVEPVVTHQISWLVSTGISATPHKLLIAPYQ